MTTIDNITVSITNGTMDATEIKNYIHYGKEQYPNQVIAHLDITLDGEFVNLQYTFKKNPPFERIRRITGYLVGTTERWNNAKKQEEKDRVKHSLELSSM